MTLDEEKKKKQNKNVSSNVNNNPTKRSKTSQNSYNDQQDQYSIPETGKEIDLSSVQKDTSKQNNLSLAAANNNTGDTNGRSTTLATSPTKNDYVSIYKSTNTVAKKLHLKMK
jgi:hypothetical protein